MTIQIRLTDIQPISPTKARVQIVLSDDLDETKAETYIRCKCTIDHPANPLVSEVEAIGLRYVRDQIGEQTQRLVALVNQRT